MLPTISSLSALAIYCISALLIFKQLDNPGQSKSMPLALASVAICLHTLTLKQVIYQPSGLNLKFFAAFSLICCLIAIQIVICSLFRRIESLGIVVFPMSGVASLLTNMGASEASLTTVGNTIQAHIMVSVIAYSLIMLGAFQALLLAYQDYSIRSHNPGGFIRFLPPLHDMETLLFQLLGFGFVCLSASLISGFFFIEDIFAQHLVHKTVLSIIGWLILAILLAGHFKFGWRGKTAIRWTLSAFAFLMLAYFGSKFVLELIL